MTIRRSVLTTIMAGASLCALASTALAADIIDPPIIAAPVLEEVKPFGGWYIRGDVGYSFNSAVEKSKYQGVFQGGPIDPNNQPPVLLGDLPADGLDSEFDDTIVVGVGVGAHMGHFLRGDITADWTFNGHNGAPFVGEVGDNPVCGTGLCGYEFGGDYNAITVLANAYVDMGTYAGITPYVGAGIGFAHVDYKDVSSTACGDPNATATSGTACDGSTVAFPLETIEGSYEGESSLRLAWSLAAGASYSLNDALAIDGGYKFTRIAEGDMLKDYNAGHSVKDGGINMHQVRLGARYKLH